MGVRVVAKAKAVASGCTSLQEGKARPKARVRVRAKARGKDSPLGLAASSGTKKRRKKTGRCLVTRLTVGSSGTTTGSLGMDLLFQTLRPNCPRRSKAS